MSLTLSKLLGLLPYGLLRLDGGGRVVEADLLARDLLGRRLGTLNGSTLDEVGFDAADINELLARVAAGPVVDWPVMLMHTESHVPLRMLFNGQHDEDTEGFALILRRAPIIEDVSASTLTIETVLGQLGAALHAIGVGLTLHGTALETDIESTLWSHVLESTETSEALVLPESLSLKLTARRVKTRDSAHFEVVESLVHGQPTLGVGVARDVTELTHARDRLDNLERRDLLTGLFTKRYFDERLGDEVERGNRYGAPLALFMVVFDGFEAYRAEHGLAVTDDALTKISDMLKERLRSMDIVARWSEAGFAVLLPETGLEGAANAAVDLRGELESALPTAPFTASIGVVARGAFEFVDAMVNRVLRAVDVAQSAGGNHVAAVSQDGRENLLSR